MKFDPLLDPNEVAAALPHFAPITAISDGIGGQGVVFRGTDQTRDLAVKIYYPGARTERTGREFSFLKRTNCQNLASIHSFGEVIIRDNLCIYSATPFIDGTLLSQLVRAGPQEIRTCAKIGCDIASAIESMWADRVVHRDIKPSNIIVARTGQSVLFDLGIARHLNMEALTTIGSTWGTQGYMSPEHARAMRTLSCKADVFSLGIVLQECLLAKHPVQGHQQLLAEGGVPTLRMLPRLPHGFAEIIDRMLEKDAYKRLSPAQVITSFSDWI